MISDIKSKHSLYTHEWVAVIAIVTLMAWLTFITHFNSYSSADAIDDPQYVVDQEIVVLIEGEVHNPGRFSMRRGDTINELLKLAQPTDKADLSRIKQNTKLRKGQKIKIPNIPMITVYLDGAVEPPRSITVPKGTLLQDLLSMVEFKEDAHIEKLRKKRRLKDGEIITVPQKKPSKNIPKQRNPETGSRSQKN